MADTLTYIAGREQGGGKVLTSAHNSHLQRARAQWQLGPDLQTWWPAGGALHHHADLQAHRHYRGFGVDRDEPNQSHPVGHPMTTAERDATGIFAPHGAPAAPRC